jgi:opacity protein-like surface antigen
LLVILLSVTFTLAQEAAAPQATQETAAPQTTQEAVAPQTTSPSPLSPVLREKEEVEVKRIDVWTLGLSFGARVLGSDAVDMKNDYFTAPVNFTQDWDENGQGYAVQLTLRYGLDRHIIPGLTAGLKLDYSYANLDVDLKVMQGSVESYRYKGGFVKTDSIALLPMIEARAFSLIEYCFRADLPAFWEIFVYVGPRINFNFYDKGDLKVDNLDAVTFGFEVGGGFEFFLSEQWSVRIEGAYYTNTSDFTVKQGSSKLFSGELDLSAMRGVLEVCWYF